MRTGGLEPVPGAPRAGDSPRLVFWEATAGCNLQCRHCRRLEVSKALSKRDLTTDQAVSRLIEPLARMAVSSGGGGAAGASGSAATRLNAAAGRASRPVLVFSGGEPLLRPDLFTLAAAAVERQLPIALATNGTLIDEETARRIAQAGFGRVAVSIDGADGATHDAFRGEPGAFEKAAEGIGRMRRRGIGLQVNTTVTRHNAGQLEGIYGKVVELGAEAWHLFMFVPVGCGLEIPAGEHLAAEQYESTLQWLALKAREGRIFVRATCAPQYFRILAENHLLKQFQGGSKFASLTKGCLAGTGICFVSHAGELFPCGYLPLSCGNVCRESFAEIWERSGVLNALRDPGRLSGKCGACEFKRMCSGCRARAYAACGDYLAEEPCCTYEPRRENVYPLS